jgi:hypothetical protein
MVSDLNRLAELVEFDSLPPWIRQEIESRREEILQALQVRGTFVLRGPHGEQVAINSKGKISTAA